MGDGAPCTHCPARGIGGCTPGPSLLPPSEPGLFPSGPAPGDTENRRGVAWEGHPADARKAPVSLSPTPPTRALHGPYREPGGPTSPAELGAQHRLSSGTEARGLGPRGPRRLAEPARQGGNAPVSRLSPWPWTRLSTRHPAGDRHGGERSQRSLKGGRGGVCGAGATALPCVPNRRRQHDDAPTPPFWKPSTKEMLLHLCVA